MNKTIRLIGIPMDLGQARRGVDMGPSALRYANLAQRLARLGHNIDDKGNVETPDRNTLPSEGGLSYLSAVVNACQSVYTVGQQAVAEECLPLFIGGDHSISAGTIGGVSHHRRVGVLWIDAHGDFNTPDTSPSGNLHGMPLAALLGYGDDALVNVGRIGPKLKPEDVILIGVRDLDRQERTLLIESGVTVYTMREIDEQGMARVIRAALNQLSHLEHLHISLDMDMILAKPPALAHLCRGGLTYREAHLLMELLADDNRVNSVDVVEINPILDRGNHTARIATELLASLLGQSIL